MLKIPEKTKIVLETGGQTYSIEGLPWDANAGELVDAFKRLLVAATFPPSVLSNEEGRWEWVENKPDDVVE